jgi:hypothetical protein
VRDAHGPLFSRPSRRVTRWWATFALANLCVGLLLALQPERLSDIANVAGWTGDWLRGQNVYANPDLVVVYPPHAVVFLSPLGALSFRTAAGLWVLANIVFVFLSGYFAARVFQPHAPFRSIVVPILMFASWWSAHTLVQFSLFSLTLSMAAMLVVDRAPLLSGFYLGAALIKPQIALPVLFWALFTRRWQAMLAAVTTVAAGFAVYCVRAGAPLFAVIEQLLANLRSYYTGNAILTGDTDLRPLIHVLVSNLSALDTFAGGLSLALLGGICAAGFQEGRWRGRLLYSAPPLAACWSLLTFYHLSYGFVVLLPVLMLLAFSDSPQTWARRALLWTLQAGMMVNVPGVLRHTGLADTQFAGVVINHFDRIFTLVILGGLIALAWRESSSPASAARTA